VPAKKRATYADLEALPEHVVGEIVDGELHVSPRPAPKHATAESRLQGELSGPFDRGRGGPGGWRILIEPELHLGADVLVPDLAGWRRERLPSVPEEAFFSLRPDWICEVLSPSTARFDRRDKLPVYVRAGVPFAWLIDPLARTLEVLKLESERWTLVRTYGNDDRPRAEPFDAIELDLPALWE
jgi:Uma2 family endonuclease